MPSVSARAWALAGALLLAAPAAAAPAGDGELSLAPWSADRPNTADVDALSLRWTMSVLADEPYVGYGVKWTLGAKGRGSGDPIKLKSSGARNQIKLGKAAVLRAAVVAPSCDRCASVEFIVPKEVKAGEDYTDFDAVSPPWDKLFRTGDGGYLPSATARRLLKGGIQLVDLEMAEPRFATGSVFRVTPKPKAKQKRETETKEGPCPGLIYC